MNAATGRLGVCLAVALGLTPLLAGRADGPGQGGTAAQAFTGNVVPLKDVLAKFGARLAPEAGPHWLALAAADGKVYPLIEDEGAKMFFADVRLRNRPMRLTGRLFADTHLLQVLDVHSLKNDRLHQVYYWCDVCSIRRNAPGVCECCGAPMELREVPVP